jgi:hypothetical protein
MNKLVIQGIVLILMLAALPLTSIGSTSELLWVSIVGLASIGFAALTPPALRFVGNSEDDDRNKKDEP